MDWTLHIVVVSGIQWQEIYKKTTDASQYVHVADQRREMIFARENIDIALDSGVGVSTWVNGDPQVSSTRVSYEYTRQYKAAFGTGYGSRPRSTCLDSINSYRDKRLNARAHPSPLIADSEIAQHQYYSASKQRSCILQMRLESILHNLTNDVSCVAERLNPTTMQVLSALLTKQIATTGNSLFSFCNGLHVDKCDAMNEAWKELIFGAETEWKRNMMGDFAGVSFPTTCGYQHVWRKRSLMKKFDVRHHFVMPGMGLAVALEDSICHHFMGGAFSHCTSFCVLATILPRRSTNKPSWVTLMIFSEYLRGEARPTPGPLVRMPLCLTF